MKKTYILLLLVLLLCLCACSSTGRGDTVATTEPIVKTVLLPLPQDGMEFSFLSGAGAWRTVLTLNQDGTFSGIYLDSEMGEVGEGYPNGSAYISEFSGTFQLGEQLDDHSYRLTLTGLTTKNAAGEEWIENEIRYVASAPHGLSDIESGAPSTDFILYLPDTPVDQLSEELLTWWPYRYDQEDPKSTLSCYGILNVATNFGFFTAE